MKVGQADVAVGPGIFFQVLLFATDRECDRHRAGPRSDLVSSIMQGVAFDQAREALPNFCFELMQNVPASEQQQFRMVVDALASSKMRDSVKVLNLGLMIMNVVGSDVLRAAVRTLGAKIQGPAKLELEVFNGLQTSDFVKAFPLLVDVSFIMSQSGSDSEREKAKKSVIDEIDSLKTRPGLDNSSKMTLLGLSLQQRVGDAVLLAALAHVAEGIQLETEKAKPEKPAAATDAAPGDQQKQENVIPLRPEGPLEPAAGAVVVSGQDPGVRGATEGPGGVNSPSLD
jgi:hypothetical protein